METNNLQNNLMPLLAADDIECRVGVCRQSGCTLLLYKDARVDMRILDMVFGPANWQRRHEIIDGNLYCTIDVWDDRKQAWVSKQDVGTESNTEKEKGRASDAFKRAAFNWGIGRELYTAPLIWVTLTEKDFDTRQKIKTKFFVREISYTDERQINGLVIVDSKNVVRYQMNATTVTTAHDSVSNNQQGQSPIGSGSFIFTGAQLQQAINEANAATDEQSMKQVWTKWSNECPPLCNVGTDFYKTVCEKRLTFNTNAAK